MDQHDLEKLVAQGESERLEFKRSTGELRAGMETLCAMLNNKGGQVLFGVTNDGKIVGQDIADSTLQDVANAIRKIEPTAWIEQLRIPVANGKEVLLLETTQLAGSPFTYDGRPYQRIGPTTSRMPSSEHQHRLLERLHAHERWENQIAKTYTIDDLDLGEIERTHRQAVDVNRLDAPFTSPRDTLDRFELTRGGQVTQAAVVLFARKMLPDFPQCELRMARFRGITKNEFIDQRQVHANAFKLLQEASLFLQRHVAVAGWFEEGKLQRQDRPQYPFLPLREAILNALCHRDYSSYGAAIHLAMYDDRLEIISPGLLPPGITIADLKRDHPSKLRNPLIAEPFYRRALIEKWGRGTQSIVEICLADGYPEPEFLEQAGAVYVRFPAGAYAPPTQVSHGLTQRQRQILAVLSDHREWMVKDILARLQPVPAKRTLQEDLRMLRDLNLVQSTGRGAGARWQLRPKSE
jgi:ATP-dependent DNA helicase RecG